MTLTALLNLAWGVYSHAQMSRAQTALVVDGRDYSYGEFAAAAGRVASWLRALPAANDEYRGPRVGILASRSFEAYAGIVGAAWAGGCFVPLGLKQPADRLNIILSKTNLDALIVDQRGALRLAELDNAPAHVLGSTTAWDELRSLGEPQPPQPVEHDDAAYVIFTSGTTGVP